MIIFFDLETMGLSESYCPILEVAAICCDYNGEMIDTFHEYINPGRPIPEEIVNLTRITDDKVKGCRREGAVLQDFLIWLRGMGCNTLIAHNIKFDLRFLKGRSEICGLRDGSILDSYRLKDTMAIARDLIKIGKFKTYKTGNGRWCVKQEAVAKALGVEYGEGGAHSAIEDVLVLKQIYYKMEGM